MPSLAYAYPSASVIAVVLAALVFATLQHAAPRLIQRVFIDSARNARTGDIHRSGAATMGTKLGVTPLNRTLKRDTAMAAFKGYCCHVDL